MLTKKRCWLFISTLISFHVDAQKLGAFDTQTGVGDPSKNGSAVYDPKSQVYTITGSGRNTWGDRDEFHFLHKKLKGDFILRFRASLVGKGVDPHRKFGWMVRSSLEPNSAHVNAAVHGDGLVSLQYRKMAGAETGEIKSTITNADIVQLERRGNRFTLSIAKFGDPFVNTVLDSLDLGQDVYAGLYVCSHNKDVIEKAVFRDVRIIKPAKPDFIPYRDYIGSNLEVMEVKTGNTRILDYSPFSLQAPNWTNDGRALIYNSKGLLYRYDLKDQKAKQIPTGFATSNNNDHVISFDGKKIGISHHSKEDSNRSVVYVLPISGGDPKRITPKSPSYLHGWSPDGKWLTYTGGREDGYDIYKISVNGGEEVRLTTAKGLDDGSEYSPDGKYIWFNSSRTGLMQIWRMKPDGSEQEQMTFDEYNNWFPHISPDGKWVVILSFSKEVAADDHPFYKHVYLRLMPASGGQPKVIGYLYGGQATINVPSWSPDSRKIAFVSNSDVFE